MTNATANTRCASGLTVAQVIEQSHMIHPDWNVFIHRGYLENEEYTDVHIELVAKILADVQAKDPYYEECV